LFGKLLNKPRKLAVFFFLLFFLFPRQTNIGFLSSRLEEILENTLGLPVQIGRLKIKGLEQIALFDVFVFSEKGSKNNKAIFHLKEILFDYRADEIWKNHLRNVLIREPTLTIDWEVLQNLKKRFKPEVAIREAQKEFDIPTPIKTKKTFRIDQIKLEGGNLIYEIHQKKFSAQDVFLNLTNVHEEGLDRVEFRVSLSQGQEPAGKIQYQSQNINLSQKQVQNLLLDIDDLDFSVLTQAAQRWLPPQFKGGRLSGKLNLHVESQKKVRGFAGSWELKTFGLEAPDGALALAGYSGKGDFQSEISKDLGNIGLKFTSKINWGQTLVGAFYQDFHGFDTVLAGNGRYEKKRDEVTLESFQIYVPKIRGQGPSSVPKDPSLAKTWPYNQRAKTGPVGEILGKISALTTADKEFDLSFDLGPIDLQKFSKWGGKEILGSFVPLFLEAEDFQGIFHFQSTFQGKPMSSTSSFRLRGKSFLQVDRFHNKTKGFELEDAVLLVPFFLHQGTSAATNRIQISAPEDLFFSWNRWKTGPFVFENGKIKGRLKDNRFQLLEPFNPKIFDGEILIPFLTIADVRNPLENLQSELHFSNIQTFPLSQALAVFPFFGTLEGHLAPLKIEKDQLATKGSIQANIFGGKVRLNDIWAQSISSANRKMGLNATLQQINLALLSQIVNFGYINGILEGQVQDFVLYGTMPLAFDVDLYTIKAPKIDHEVGIEAVRKIAIFAGASSALKFLDEGLYRFIDVYKYEAFGAKARLDKGLLKLDAKLRNRKDQKLFLKGRSFPRIDVVYNAGGGEVMYEAFVQQIKAVQLGFRKENEKNEKGNANE
jgi:hypothetical protein